MESEYSLKVDSLLNASRNVADATERFIHCENCQNSVQIVGLIVMNFQTLFRLAKVLAHPPETPCPDPEIQMGQYEMSVQEGVMLKDMLVARTFGKLYTALSGLNLKAEEMQTGAKKMQL